MEQLKNFSAEEVIFECLDSTSVAFLTLLQKYVPQWFRSDAKWPLTDQTDPVRWACQNSVPLFEIKAYLLYVLDGSLFKMKQTGATRAATVDHCLVRIAEYLLQLTPLDDAEIAHVSNIVWGNRIRQYHDQSNQSDMDFLGPLQWPCTLLNNIRAGIGARKAPVVFPIIIDGDIFDPVVMVALRSLLGQLGDLVVKFAEGLQRSMAGTNDYRKKGNQEISRLFRQSLV